MDVMVKMARFQIKQNVINLKSTLVSQVILVFLIETEFVLLSQSPYYLIVLIKQAFIQQITIFKGVWSNCFVQFVMGYVCFSILYIHL